jgi:hypothetical protein
VPAGAAPTPEKKRTRRLRLWLAIGGGIMALLCLGGVGIAISLYDGATRIKRSAPTAVVDNFLGAYFVDNNDEDASLYLCKSGVDIAALESFRASLREREAKTGNTVTVGWKNLEVVENDVRTRTVSAVLTIDGVIDNQPVSGSEHPWKFTLIDDDGWRICSATGES